MDRQLLVECPIQDPSCPYWDWKTHKCTMPLSGLHPIDECDDYYAEVGDEE